jgi:hypothetical protein
VFMGIFGRLLAIGMLIWALDDHEYGNFTVLRIVVCIVTVYLSGKAFLRSRKVSWTSRQIIRACHEAPMEPEALNALTPQS